MAAPVGLMQYDPLTGVGNVTITNPEGWSKFEGGRAVAKQVNETEGGVVAVHLEHFFDEYLVTLQGMYGLDATVQTFMEDVAAMWAWVGKGGRFKIAMDSTDVVDQDLDGAANAGQKVIPLNGTSGIQVGNKYRMTSVLGEGWQREIIEVDSISAGVSVTAVNNLKFNYVSGDSFISRFFFPKAMALQDVSPIREKPAHEIDFQLRFRTFEDIETA